MNDIILKLTQLGFSSYEAKVYFALLRKQPAIGYEISKIAKIPTAKIYEVLTNLKNKGAVMASSSEPVYYSPIPPETLLTRLKQDFITKIEDLEGELKQVNPIPAVDITWNLTGYKTVIDRIAGVIENSQTSILLSVWPDEAELIKEHIRKAEKRGVKVIVGVFGSFDLEVNYKINLEQCGASSQNRLGKRLTVVVGDAKEGVISEIGSVEDTIGVYTTTPSIVLVAKEYIKHDMWGRTLIDVIGEERFKQLCNDSELLSYIIKNR